MQEEAERFKQLSVQRAELRNQIRELEGTVSDFRVSEARWEADKQRRDQHIEWLEQELKNKADELSAAKVEKIALAANLESLTSDTNTSILHLSQQRDEYQHRVRGTP